LYSVDFAAAQNHIDVLADAMRELNYNVVVSADQKSLRFSRYGTSGTYSNGRFTSYGDSQIEVDQIKQKFAAGCVRKAAKKLGWTVKQDGNKGKITAKGGW
jgi:hypothetical protein